MRDPEGDSLDLSSMEFSADSVNEDAEDDRRRRFVVVSNNDICAEIEMQRSELTTGVGKHSGMRAVYRDSSDALEIELRSDFSQPDDQLTFNIHLHATGKLADDVLPVLRFLSAFSPGRELRIARAYGPLPKQAALQIPSPFLDRDLALYVEALGRIQRHSPEPLFIPAAIDGAAVAALRWKARVLDGEEVLFELDEYETPIDRKAFDGGSEALISGKQGDFLLVGPLSLTEPDLPSLELGTMAIHLDGAIPSVVEEGPDLVRIRFALPNRKLRITPFAGLTPTTN